MASSVLSICLRFRFLGMLIRRLLASLAATFALLDDGMDIHTLAIQMGTSIGMIEKHYSHLTPHLKKEMLTGKRYELGKEL